MPNLEELVQKHAPQVSGQRKIPPKRRPYSGLGKKSEASSSDLKPATKGEEKVETKMDLIQETQASEKKMEVPKVREEVETPVKEAPKAPLKMTLNNTSDSIQDNTTKVVESPSIQEIIKEEKVADVTRDEPKVDKVANPIKNSSAVESESSEEIDIFLKKAEGVIKNILLYLYKIILDNDGEITPKISTSDVSGDLGTNVNTTRGSIKRLISLKIIKLVDSKPGRYGWAIYGIDVEIREKIAYYYSSSDKSGGDGLVEVSPIRIPVVMLEAGFKQDHIQQCRRIGIIEKDLHQFLEEYAYDVANCEMHKSIKDHLSYFMSIMRKQKEYKSIAGYRPPEELIMEEMLRKKKNELDKREKMRAELFDAAFKDWVATTSRVDILKLVPSNVGEPLGIIHIEEVKDYYKIHVWPKYLRES
jgi:hypothetical protein